MNTEMQTMSETSFFSKLKKELTTRQRLSLVSALLLQFAAFASLSVIAPFFPTEAGRKGMSESVAGFVFSVYALVLMIMSSVIGKLLPFVGIRFVLISGIIFVGVCNILFGVLNRISSNETFTVLCFVVRSFEAMGAAAMNNAACTYVMKMFPDFTTTAFGVIKTVIGIGLSFGPAIGAWLYSIGGYGLPFFVLGSVVLLNAPICYFFMRPTEDMEVKQGDTVTPCTARLHLTYWRMLSIPGVVVTCIVIFVISQNIGFLGPTLSPHLLEHNMDSKYSGIAFFIISTAYAVSSLIVGFWFASSSKFFLTFFGLLFTTIGFILIGPSSFIPIQTNFWLTCVACAIIGIATSVAITPSFQAILLKVNSKGYSDDISTYGLISGLWSSMWSLGDITGPALGGLMAQNIGFSGSVTYVALLTAATTALVIIESSCSKNDIEEQQTLVSKKRELTQPTDRQGAKKTSVTETKCKDIEKSESIRRSYGTSF